MKSERVVRSIVGERGESVLGFIVGRKNLGCSGSPSLDFVNVLRCSS